MRDEPWQDADWSWQDRMGLDRLINVSGTMTSLGGSVTAPEVAEATAAAMTRFASIHQMQTCASKVIADLTGAQAGFLTASASAGMSLAIAGCMSGLDAGRAQALPAECGPQDRVVVQMGHLCAYGAPVSTAVDLTGARVRQVGQSTLVTDHHLADALRDDVAAALYVVSHHVVHYGQMPLRRFAEMAHAADVPVIVDAASEYDLRGFLEAGADLVIYSAHKFMGGPTAGIIAGRRDLVRAAYLQNIGIGRGMKIGKESIAGAIAAMELWKSRDHAAVRAHEEAALDLWQSALAPLPGVTARRVPDPTGNPLHRLQVEIDAATTGIGPAAAARALGRRNPAIVVRDHEVELGYFQLDPCNLLAGQGPLVSTALVEVLSSGGSGSEPEEEACHAIRNGGTGSYLRWLDE